MDIEQLIPGFYQKCDALSNHASFGFTQKESSIIVMMFHDFKPEEIAKIFSRSCKTIYKHRENCLKKVSCNTFFAMACKLKETFPYL